MDKILAITEPNRRKIIELLAERGQMSAAEISHQFHSSAPAVSQHLKILKDNQAISMRKAGQQRIYQLNPQALDQLQKWLHSINAWQARLNSLDRLINSKSINKRSSNGK